ncbi:MAG: hypothetical protein K2I14_04185 [Eubacterium sp.]|nr:hypothetical protein [Eubacterium sp.]
MKKRMIIILILLLCIISLVAAYFIYGNTLIDVTNEQSISDHLAANPENPITILKTEQLGDYFGILYTDPVDADEGYYHFRHITKAALYKNRYHNIGSSSKMTEGFIGDVDANSGDERRTKAELLFYRVGNDIDNDNKCSVFLCHYRDEEQINYKEINSVEELVERLEKNKVLDEKLDEFDLPDDTFIMSKTYDWDDEDGYIFVTGTSLTPEEKFQSEVESKIEEYRLYLAGEINLDFD